MLTALIIWGWLGVLTSFAGWRYLIKIAADPSKPEAQVWIGLLSCWVLWPVVWIMVTREAFRQLRKARR